MDLELTDRVAVITAGSKGIGLAVTQTLLDEGAHVVVASRSAPPLDDPRVTHVAADLTDPGAPAAAIDAAIDVHGRLDVLVNNAGGQPPGVDLPHDGFLGRSDADWHAVVDFNLLSAMRACRAAMPHLIEQGGSIVNVASANAHQALPFNIDYGAAKAALVNATKALSEEFSPQGVRVNAVSPGPVLTDWWTKEGGVGDQIAAQAGTDRATALATVVPESMGMTTGRLATAQEIADVVALLCSPRSASTTGVEYLVEGGLIKAI